MSQREKQAALEREQNQAMVREWRLAGSVDGGPAVRSPRLVAELIVGVRPSDFDGAVQRLEGIAEFVAEAGTKLIPAARGFAR